MFFSKIKLFSNLKNSLTFQSDLTSKSQLKSLYSDFCISVLREVPLIPNHYTLVIKKQLSTLRSFAQATKPLMQNYIILMYNHVKG